MSPRWGFGHRGMSPIYKHVAPLGLKNVTRFLTTTEAPVFRHRSSGAKERDTILSYTHSTPLERMD